MTKHTPEPWTIERAGNSRGHRVLGGDGTTVAFCDQRDTRTYTREGALELTKANACLIVKAPKMRNELQGVLRLFERDDVPTLRDGEGVRMFMTYKQAERLRALLREIDA